MSAVEQAAEIDRPQVQLHANPDHPRDCHAPCCDLGGYLM